MESLSMMAEIQSSQLNIVRGAAKSCPLPKEAID